MNILMITYGSLMQKLYHALPREIAKLPGVNLTVVVPHRWKELWKKGWLKLEDDHADGYTLKKIGVWFAGNLHFAVYQSEILSLIKKVQPDIIDHENETFNAGSAQVVYYRNRFSQKSSIIMHASQNIYKRYPPPFNYFEKYSLKNVDAIFARSQDAANVLLRKGYNGKIEIVTHGVDVEAFRCGSREEIRGILGLTNEFVIGFIGALVEHKGIDIIIRAIQPLDCKLLIIGDGILLNNLKNLVKELKVEEKVIFHPSISHEEVPKYLSAMDLFVFPSRTLKNLREQFGRVLIEAMASGVPVIGSDCGEIPVIIGSNRQIFPENNWLQLRECIVYFMQNAHARQMSANYGKERVEKLYSWHILAKRIYNVYQHVLDKK